MASTAVPASLGGLVFRAVANTAHGRIGTDTVLRFTADDGRVAAGGYAGGAIATGHVLAARIEDGAALELLYQGAAVTGEIRAGRARATFAIDDDGRLRMRLDWRWLTGEPAAGQSEWLAWR